LGLRQFLRGSGGSGAARKANIMSDIKTYRDLDAWQGAMDLSESIYRLTQVFPDTERYGLISQLRRSSVSIPSNIAEGQARGTAAFGLHLLRIAIGSAACWREPTPQVPPGCCKQLPSDIEHRTSDIGSPPLY